MSRPRHPWSMAQGIRFARKVSIKAKPDKVEEFLSTMREKLYPSLSREKGLRRIYLLRDTTSPNEFVSLTLWNSRSDAHAYESSGHFSANTDLIRQYMEEDPVASPFEVEYHTISPALPPPAARRRPRAVKARRPAKRRRS